MLGSTDRNQVFSLINSIAMCFEVKYGMGRHVENVGMEEGLEQLKVCTPLHARTPHAFSMACLFNFPSGPSDQR